VGQPKETISLVAAAEAHHRAEHARPHQIGRQHLHFQAEAVRHPLPTVVLPLLLQVEVLLPLPLVAALPHLLLQAGARHLPLPAGAAMRGLRSTH